MWYYINVKAGEGYAEVCINMRQNGRSVHSDNNNENTARDSNTELSHVIVQGHDASTCNYQILVLNGKYRARCQQIRGHPLLLAFQTTLCNCVQRKSILSKTVGHRQLKKTQKTCVWSRARYANIYRPLYMPTHWLWLREGTNAPRKRNILASKRYFWKKKKSLDPHLHLWQKNSFLYWRIVVESVLAITKEHVRLTYIYI